MNPAADLVGSRRHILLDFDGPVCAVFGSISDQAVADRLRTFVPGALPAEVAAATDPFAILKYSATRSSDVQARVEGELCRLEVAAVADAPDTPGAAHVVRQLHEAGHTVTVVSNNSASAINTYLHSRNLARYVEGVSAREPAQPLTLKPHPHLLHMAMRTLKAEPAECVMVGDSVSDIHAAYRAHTSVIALANKPGKRERFESHHPSVIIAQMSQLID